MKDELKGIPVPVLMEIVKMVLRKDPQLEKPLSEMSMGMSMRNIISDQLNSSFFSRPTPTLTTNAWSMCQKCNHVMNNHVRYGKTNWHYCKTCLSCKRKSDCV